MVVWSVVDRDVDVEVEERTDELDVDVGDWAGMNEDEPVFMLVLGTTALLVETELVALATLPGLPLVDEIGESLYI